MILERQMIHLPETKKHELRKVLEVEETRLAKESRRKITVHDFESLAVIGRGAFGEVRLVRRRGKPPDFDTEIFALKSMKKEMMIVKNQVNHVISERNALAAANKDAALQNHPWLTVLHSSFFDEAHLYMCMEFLPGGDLMSLLIKEDTFSEEVTKFFMAEAAQAISSVHALGYIHRDIKPDNMLLTASGHLKLTDLGLCKKVGDMSPGDEPDMVLAALARQRDQKEYHPTLVTSGSLYGGGGGKHRSSNDAMAMSIDNNVMSDAVTSSGPPQARDAKARREVRFRNIFVGISCVFCLICFLSHFGMLHNRWRTVRLDLQTI
jgi:serine/threonine kinase 38